MVCDGLLTSQTSAAYGTLAGHLRQERREIKEERAPTFISRIVELAAHCAFLSSQPFSELILGHFKDDFLIKI